MAKAFKVVDQPLNTYELEILREFLANPIDYDSPRLKNNNFKNLFTAIPELLWLIKSPEVNIFERLVIEDSQKAEMAFLASLVFRYQVISLEHQDYIKELFKQFIEQWDEPTIMTYLD